MAIKIDKNVPIPSAQRKGSKYPWAQMQVGDSFFVPGKAKGLYQAAKANNIKITVRTVKEKGKEGVRVWCTEASTSVGNG